MIVVGSTLSELGFSLAEAAIQALTEGRGISFERAGRVRKIEIPDSLSDNKKFLDFISRHVAGGSNLGSAKHAQIIADNARLEAERFFSEIPGHELSESSLSSFLEGIKFEAPVLGLSIDTYITIILAVIIFMAQKRAAYNDKLEIMHRFDKLETDFIALKRKVEHKRGRNHVNRFAA